MECPFCESGRLRLLSKDEGRETWRCLECGEVFEDDFDDYDTGLIDMRQPYQIAADGSVSPLPARYDEEADEFDDDDRLNLAWFDRHE